MAIIIIRRPVRQQSEAEAEVVDLAEVEDVGHDGEDHRMSHSNLSTRKAT
jgi:hypothetical protein